MNQLVRRIGAFFLAVLGTNGKADWSAGQRKQRAEIAADRTRCDMLFNLRPVGIVGEHEIECGLAGNAVPEEVERTARASRAGREGRCLLAEIVRVDIGGAIERRAADDLAGDRIANGIERREITVGDKVAGLCVARLGLAVDVGQFVAGIVGNCAVGTDHAAIGFTLVALAANAEIEIVACQQSAAGGCACTEPVGKKGVIVGDEGEEIETWLADRKCFGLHIFALGKQAQRWRHFEA